MDDKSSRSLAVCSTAAAETSINESPAVVLSSSASLDSWQSSLSSAGGDVGLSDVETPTYSGIDVSGCKKRAPKRSRGMSTCMESGYVDF